MRCNACWRELEGQAVSTTCGHIFCTEDANKILSNDAACPICDEVISRSLLKPVDINPTEEWTNMAMVAISPQTLLKSAYRSVMFYIGQKELEMQFKMNHVVAECRQKCETMQEKFTDKLEEVHTSYQKMVNRCQVMEQEIESLSKDKQELQEKFAEKSRQKRKLEEMYDQLKSDYEMMKRPIVQPSNSFFSRPDGDLFSNHQPNVMDNQDANRKGPGVDVWPRRQKSPHSGHFNFSDGSPLKKSAMAVDMVHKRDGGRPVFATGTRAANSKSNLRNLLLSPLKRPQPSRNRPPMFTL